MNKVSKATFLVSFQKSLLMGFLQDEKRKKKVFVFFLMGHCYNNVDNKTHTSITEDKTLMSNDFTQSTQFARGFKKERKEDAIMEL